MGVVAGTAFLTEAMLGYLKLQQLVVPAGPMIAGSALNIIALMAWRIFFSRVLLEKMRSERVIFLGDSPLVQEIASHLEAHPEKGLTPLGFLGDSNLPSGKRLGAISDLREVVDRLHPAANRGGLAGAPFQFAGDTTPGTAALRHSNRRRAEHLRDGI